MTQLDQGTSLLERLEQRAAPTGGPSYSGLNYNYPLAWYRRPNDGDIVQLQSDPNNRTMYEDLGFVFLRPPEVREWLDDVRPGVILDQKKRARLITEIRKYVAKIPQLSLTEDEELAFPTMPIEELEDRFKEICEQFGLKPRLPSIKPEPARAPGDAHLTGVETSMSMEELDAKMQRGRGYDPTREGRRRP